MKIVTILFVSLVVLARGVWASPFSEGEPASKPSPSHTLKALNNVLFPGGLDGISSLPSFRVLPKKTSESASLFEAEKDFLAPAFVSERQKRNFVSKSKQVELPHRFYLESQYAALDHPGPARMQDPEYSNVLKTTSLGIAYPLTRKLTLDGRYIVVKGMQEEALSPWLGGTYRLNAATSISVSYPDIRPEDENTIRNSATTRSHPAAELKIHF